MTFDFKKIQIRIKNHLSKSFLVVIRDEDTFEEISSYKLSLLNIYILLSTVFCISGLIMFLLIILTPLKNLVPGYGDISFSGEYVELSKKIQNIEQELIARDVYIDGLKRLLSGNPQTVKDVTKDVHFKLESPDPVGKIKEDSLLRTSFENKRPNDIKGAKKTNKITDNLSSSLLKKKLEDIDFTCPLRGPIGANFKPNKSHFGVDVIGPENSPIKAILSGTIIQSDWSIENGYTIAIQHNDNLVSIYKHNSTLFKKLGAQVRAGEVIAIIGNTGTLTQGPHLHFELWYQAKCLNPLDYIRFN